MEAADVATAAWLDAIATRTYYYARQLLRSDQDVNVRGPSGETALHVAAQRGFQNKIKKLLLEGADPSATDAQGHTPLQVAQRLNQVEAVVYLLRHEELLRSLSETLGQPPELTDIVATVRHKKMRRFREEVRERVMKNTAKIIEAARKGDLKIVRGMLEASEISIDTIDCQTLETAFSAALASEQRHVCEYLLLNGAHLHAPCLIRGRYQSSLVAGVNGGDVHFVRQLVAHGAMLAVPEMDPLTCPLAEAVKIGSIEMLTAFQELGARASPHRHGITFPELAGIVFRFGTWNTHIETPWWLLSIAVWYQDTAIIQHLFRTYEDVFNDREMMLKRGSRALFLAVYQQNQEIATELLYRGASANHPLKWNATAMVAAVAVNSVKMLRFLLDRGGDIHVSHRSSVADATVIEGLLAIALHFDALACAHVLLPISTLPQHLDQALAVSAKRGDVEFAGVLLDIALPSTPEAFRLCVRHARCPLTLDLLLSRCAELYDVSALGECYKEACQIQGVDLGSVFMAHGFDSTTGRGKSTTPVEWWARRNSV